MYNKIGDLSVADYDNNDECEDFNNDQILAKYVDEVNGFNYKIRFNTVDEIVAKNLNRKDNSLSFYPFNKQMDKFGTIYISIFAEKRNSHANLRNRFNVPDSIIKALIYSLGTDYHYISLPIKNQILFYPGI